MHELNGFDFQPSLDKSPCLSCPNLIRELGNQIISQGIALIQITELCPPYKAASGMCIVKAMEHNTMIAEQTDYFNE